MRVTNELDLELPTLEAAERVGLDVVEVYKLIDAGTLTARWDGTRLVVRLADLQANVRPVS